MIMTESSIARFKKKLLLRSLVYAPSWPSLLNFISLLWENVF